MFYSLVFKLEFHLLLPGKCAEEFYSSRMPIYALIPLLLLVYAISWFTPHLYALSLCGERLYALIWCMGEFYAH